MPKGNERKKEKNDTEEWDPTVLWLPALTLDDLSQDHKASFFEMRRMYASALPWPRALTVHVKEGTSVGIDVYANTTVSDVRRALERRVTIDERVGWDCICFIDSFSRMVFFDRGDNLLWNEITDMQNPLVFCTWRTVSQFVTYERMLSNAKN